jgi:hypothetical protein
MTKKIKERTFEEATAWLRENGFDVMEVPSNPNRVFVKKHGCSAAIERSDTGGVKLFAKPGYLIGGEIARLVDKGFQKFLKTSKSEIPASADHLKAIHQFSEELHEGSGSTSLYNEALGTVSDRYQYDRIKDRDESIAERPKRPWERAKQTAKKPA